MSAKNAKRLRAGLAAAADAFLKRCEVEIRPWDNTARAQYAEGFIGFSSERLGIKERVIRHMLRRHPLFQPLPPGGVIEAVQLPPISEEVREWHRMAELVQQKMTASLMVPAEQLRPEGT